MKVSRSELYRLVVEEYAKEEGIVLTEMDDTKYEEFLAWIKKKGPRPEWLDDKDREIPDPPSLPAAPTSGDETWVMEKPPGDPEPEPDIEDQLAALIQGMEPEAVAELFQAVFEKIPGVELERPSDDEPGPPTEYGGEEFDLRDKRGQLIGIREDLQLEGLMELIREVLDEGAYTSYGTHSMAGPPGNRDDEDRWHDMGDPETEMYDVLDPEGLEGMPDKELLDLADRAGIETHLHVDSPGSFSSAKARAEIIAHLKDV